MSTRTFASLILSMGLASIFSAAAVAQAPVSQAAAARMGTFEKEGQDFYALTLLSQVAADPAQKNDVVILVDTSASQTGRYRAEQMTAVQSMLATLSPND